MSRPGARHYLVAGAVLVGAGLAGAGLFVASGLYNVSASRDHVDLTTWVLDVVRRRSVETHAMGITAPPLGDAGMIRLGARYFEAGCAPCHGAPGRPPSAVGDAMLPSPPSLAEPALAWSDAELFWIVHNGQKYTGMPAWIAPRREDEVWPVVAFLKRLPGLGESAYADLAGIAGDNPPGAAFLDEPGAGIEVCAACHGMPDGQPVDDLVPRLGGLDQGYLERTLRSYASGDRESGMMQLFAAGLSEDEIAALAAAYAAGSPGPAVAGDVAGNIAAGAGIFELGIPEDGVPACVSCHTDAKAHRFPRLAGQAAAYVHQQLDNWREGLRSATPHGQIMARIGERLTAEQAADVAAYVGTLPPPKRGVE